MDGYYGLDDHLDSWDRHMRDLTEEEQNRLWDEQMYGRNGHNPPAPRKVDPQPVMCPKCGTTLSYDAEFGLYYCGQCDSEFEDDGQYYCWLCEYQW